MKTAVLKELGLTQTQSDLMVSLYGKDTEKIKSKLTPTEKDVERIKQELESAKARLSKLNNMTSKKME